MWGRGYMCCAKTSEFWVVFAHYQWFLAKDDSFYFFTRKNGQFFSEFFFPRGLAIRAPGKSFWGKRTNPGGEKSLNLLHVFLPYKLKFLHFRSAVLLWKNWKNKRGDIAAYITTLFMLLNCQRAQACHFLRRNTRPKVKVWVDPEQIVCIVLYYSLLPLCLPEATQLPKPLSSKRIDILGERQRACQGHV